MSAVSLPAVDPPLRPPPLRSFAPFAAVSIGLHVVALALLPGWSKPDVTAEPLEVTLERLEPPRVFPSAAPPAPPAPTRAPRESARPKPPEKKVIAPAPRREPEPPRTAVLTAPAPASPEAPPVAPDPPPPPPVSSQPAVAQPAPAARTDAADAQPGSASRAAGASAAGDKTTPPGFNAAYLRNPPPRYPVSARRSGEQGTVLLRVLVTRGGTAASVDLEKSSGSAALDQAAQDAVRAWRFVPARRGGQAVEAQVLVPVVFRLEGS